MRADSGFYAHAIVAVCRDKDVRFSITVRQHESLRSQIDAIPEADWTPIPYWMEGAADVAETSYSPFQSEPNAAPVQLIVRRVKPTPGSQLALFAAYSYHGFITDRDGATLALEADHRRHAEIENAIRDLKYGVGLNHLPSGRFAANPEPAEGGLAGRAEPAPYSIRGHRPQIGSLDNARRPGRATGNHLRSSTTSVRGAHSPHPAESLRIKALQPLSRTSHPCLGQRDCIPSVDSGLTVKRAICPREYRDSMCEKPTQFPIH